MTTYHITETIYYYVDANSEEEALDKWSELDKSSASKVYLECQEY